MRWNISLSPKIRNAWANSSRELIARRHELEDVIKFIKKEI